jgi:Domain of unknown function (DUF1844)
MSKAPPDSRAQATAEAAMRSIKGETMPEVDFATFMLSLATSALVHLGEQPGPDSEGTEAAGQVDLPLARQTIDMMAMLRDKTKGNLSAEESRLTDSLLYDLRMRYVEKAK